MEKPRCDLVMGEGASIIVSQAYTDVNHPLPYEQIFWYNGDSKQGIRD
jgi:hypothetical protein